MPQGRISRRVTLWLGNDELTAGGYGFDIHSEDDMIAISGDVSDQESLEVFIQPDLFPAIRRVMDQLEGRKEGTQCYPNVTSGSMTTPS